MLPFLFLIAISPAMHYVVNTFTFSLRLELSKYSAMLLNRIGMAVQNKGSYFIMPNGNEFNVDTACIGLNMFNTGLAVMLLMIGFSEQRTKNKLNVYSLLIIFTATIFCLILTNLFRIVGLVLFKSPPETLQHDLIGIASLILYTLLPIYFLITFLQKKQKLIIPTKIKLAKKSSLKIEDLGVCNKDAKNKTSSFKRNALLTILTSILLITISTIVKSEKKESIKDEKLARLVLKGFEKQFKEDGVVEFSKNNVLIYIKPSAKGYASDHPPSICWQGAGFKLEEITEIEIDNHKILSAILKKEDFIQYTAWWYDNGTDKTINQWKWRLTKGESYRIVNVTTNNKQQLDSLCDYYLKQKLF